MQICQLHPDFEAIEQHNDLMAKSYDYEFLLRFLRHLILLDSNDDLPKVVQVLEGIESCHSAHVAELDPGILLKAYPESALQRGMQNIPLEWLRVWGEAWRRYKDGGHKITLGKAFNLEGGKYPARAKVAKFIRNIEEWNSAVSIAKSKGKWSKAYTEIVDTYQYNEKDLGFDDRSSEFSVKKRVEEQKRIYTDDRDFMWAVFDKMKIGEFSSEASTLVLLDDMSNYLKSRTNICDSNFSRLPSWERVVPIPRNWLIELVSGWQRYINDGLSFGQAMGIDGNLGAMQVRSTLRKHNIEVARAQAVIDRFLKHWIEGSSQELNSAISSVATYSGMSERTIQNAFRRKQSGHIDLMEECGFIKKDP